MQNMEENSDKIWTIWKKGKLKSKMVWKIQKKSKVNSEKIGKIWKKSGWWWQQTIVRNVIIEINNVIMKKIWRERGR